MTVEEKYQKETPTNVAGSSRNKLLYKYVLYSVKIIPILISGIYVLNTVFSYFNVDWPGFSYIVQFLFIGFIYLTALAFRFCIYHRLFIHYIFVIFVLNIIDYHWEIPLSDRELFSLYIAITGIFLFLILYLHQKHRKQKHY